MFKRIKKGQVSVFVIIALVIIGGIAGYFVVSSQISPESDNPEFSEVYSYYSSCIEQYARTGLSLGGMQGGWIDVEPYQPGSDYAPFGNQLAVGGSPVTYWYTIEGNGISKERIPTNSDFEKQLGEYILNRLEGCSMDLYRDRGLEIFVSPAQVKTSLTSDGVIVNVDSTVIVSNGNSSSQKGDFSVTVQSNFGQLLNQAREIYSAQQKILFLENYSYDVLRLYAPVDGVEIQCAPKIWKAEEIFSDLQMGLVENLAELKFSGDHYTPSKNTNDKYYELGVEVKGVDGVQVIYDASWPSRFEVYGNEGSLLIAKPIGNDAGLNTLGFCYVPYHFVYDMMFPVLFRLSKDQDMFQFPVVVIIDKNVPRKSFESSFSPDYGDTSDLCSSATQTVDIQVRDSEGAVQNADVSYSCFDQECPIGKTNNKGYATGIIPTCLNGFLNINSDGHLYENYLFSSHNSTSATVYLTKEYPISLNLLVDGKLSKDLAFISFTGNKENKQGTIPDSPIVSLSSGFYNVTVYQYGNTSIRVPSSTSTQCIQVSSGGIRGLLGATEEKCFEVAIPETTISQALTAGGTGEIFLPEELLQSGNLTLTVSSLPKPSGIESLETNYALFELQGVDVLYE